MHGVAWLVAGTMICIIALRATCALLCGTTRRQPGSAWLPSSSYNRMALSYRYVRQTGRMEALIESHSLFIICTLVNLLSKIETCRQTTFGPHHSGAILYLHTSVCSNLYDHAIFIREAPLKTPHSVNGIHQLSVTTLTTALRQLYGMDTVSICIKLEAEAFGCVASS